MVKKINKKTSKQLPNKLLFWTPRIIILLFIIFISIFALDVFSEGYGFLETIVALFMHLIPSIVLTIILIIAWKHEKIGGIIFIIMAIVFGFFFKAFKEIIGFLILCMPLLIIGGLFLLNYYKNK